MTMIIAANLGEYVLLAMFELISKPDNSVSPNADFIVITKKHKPYFMGN